MFEKYDRYYRLAEELGLRIAPADGVGMMTVAISVEGVVEGRRVSLRRYIGKQPHVRVGAPIAPALDLGLAVAPRGVLESLKTAFGSMDVEVGHPPFDHAFAIRADEPARAQALLTEDVQRAIVSANLPPSIVDGKVSFFHAFAMFDTDGPDQAFLADTLRGAVAIVAAIDRARAVTPPAAALAPLAPGLTAFARDNGLDHAFDAPSRAFGTIGGAQVIVASRREGKDRYALEIAVGFEQPLGFHLVVSTARTGPSTWLQGQDVQLGDPAFDAAFDVRTEDRERLLTLLDAASRAELVAASAGRQLQLDGFALRLRAAAGDFDPVTLPTTIQRLVDVVNGIARNGRVAPPQLYR
jgi:hypothetical protein